MRKNLIVILGPTASGKTTLAVKLAVDFQGEIISADSRQVYKGMDIGTGKDLPQYQIDGRIVPYHLIDILEPNEEFNVFEFQKRFFEVFNNLQEKRVLPMLVGGTGLYLESVLADYYMPYAKQDESLREDLAGKSLKDLQEILTAMKPQLHNKTDIENRERLLRKIEIERARRNPDGISNKRPVLNAGIFGIFWERSVLRQRIAARLKQRLEEGLIDEVWQLHLQGLSWERLDSLGLEYRYIAGYLQNKMTKNDMTAKLQIAIAQFAKRQMTWFRRMEKKGVKIDWLSGDDYATLYEHALKILS